MRIPRVRRGACALVAVAAWTLLGVTGCGGPALQNIFSMGIFTPIPVPPWVTEREQEKFAGKQDYKTVIMPPIREGFPPPMCEDPPDKAMVIRALENVARGVPYVYEEFRDDIDVVAERMVDRIDPPRFYPLIGPAQLHHCHWKCTVYYTETVESGYPFPVKLQKQAVKVLMIDKDHLHLCRGRKPRRPGGDAPRPGRSLTDRRKSSEGINRKDEG